MHNLVRQPIAKNQKDIVNHKNKKDTSFPGHDSFGGRKEEEAWRESDQGTTCNPMYCGRAEPCPRKMDWEWGCQTIRRVQTAH